jgi:hypothetical protein
MENGGIKNDPGVLAIELEGGEDGWATGTRGSEYEMALLYENVLEMGAASLFP